MENPKINIEWLQKSGKDCLKFTFIDKFTEQAAQKAAQEWRNEFSKKTHNVVIIWDCLKMKGYDKEARIIWQGLCKELEDQIESIRVISNSIVTKMGATVISAFTSLKINIVASEDDIPL